MRNPFPYGRVATGGDFADRARELRELCAELEEGGRVFLISPRRYGKTSLIVKALERLRSRGLLTAYLDLYDVTTVEQFAAHYARAVAKAAETTTEAVVDFIRAVIPTLRPKVTIGPGGDISVGVDAAPGKPELSLILKDILELPARLAAKRKRGFVVALDEFQEVRTLGGAMLERMMRSSFQHQAGVGYLFAGSKQHIMSDMVSDKSRPFYKMGAVRFLGKLPEAELRGFISAKFALSGQTIEPQALSAVLAASRAIPYYVLHLCHELWERNEGLRRIPAEAVAPAVESLVEKMAPLFLSIWDGLTLPQRHLAQAIAARGGREPFSGEFIRANQLGTASAVQKALKLLVRKGVLEKEYGEHRFCDIWFGEWVRRRGW